MTGDKVLVIGDDTRSFLAIVRSLGRRGVVIHVAPSNFRSSALRSRYIAAVQDLPPWMGDGDAWLTAMITLLRAERYDLVIACDETSLLPLQRHRATLSQLTCLGIPNDAAIAVLFDKYETRELAKRLGIPVAAGRLAKSDDTAEKVMEEFGAPVVIKPRHSYSLEMLAARGKVQVLEEQAHLTRVLNESDPDETLIEQFFAGRGVGVSVLASRGRVLQFFEHHRVREIAGASFYRCSATLTPHLGQACAAIISTLGYTGLAMFEFKLDSSGDWILLEVNARPWGSMPLPVALGVDFPYRWYRLLTAGEETAAVTYRAGVYGRNLVPDLRNSMIEAKERKLGPIATVCFFIARIAEMRRVLGGRELNDILVHDDLRPGFVELVRITRSMCRRALPGATAWRRRQVRAQVEAVVRRSAGELHVIFVCQGNICRSPFAELLLRARLGDTRVAASSAGMNPRPGRTTPGFGLEAAMAHGIDLSSHRSVWLSRRMAETASLLVAFDDMTRTAVLDRYPALEVPLILLGDLAGLGQIADPVNGDVSEFRRVYEQISTGITVLTLLLRGTALCAVTPGNRTPAAHSEQSCDG